MNWKEVLDQYREQSKHADDYICPCNGHSQLTYNHCQAEHTLQRLEKLFQEAAENIKEEER